MAVAALATAANFTSYAFAQSYLESRGYLRGEPETDTREIHAIAAWALLHVHDGRSGTADAGESEPLLVRWGAELAELQRALQEAQKGAGTVAEVIAAYKSVQQLADEVGKRELVVARVTAALMLTRLEKKSWDDIKTSVNVILNTVGLAYDGSESEIWKQAVTGMGATGSVYRKWDDSFKKETWASTRGLKQGVGRLWIDGESLFLPSVQTNIKAAVNTAPGDDEW